MVLPQKPISYKEMNEAKLVSFRHLGVGQRLSEAVKELGILFPAEIHCAGIPPILKGKSLVLTSHNESVGSFTLGVLTYLLPLIQVIQILCFCCALVLPFSGSCFVLFCFVFC